MQKVRFAALALLGAAAIWAGVCCFGNAPANVRQDSGPISAEHPGLAVAAEAAVETDVDAAVPEGPATSAGSVCVMTGDGVQLAGKADTEFVSIASTTKIMTALLTLELGEGQLDEPFNVGDEVKVEGSALGIKPGAEVTLRLLAWGMLLSSGNDAAAAAAMRLGGSFEGFAALMNERAKEIGMENTVFVTPSGLDAENQGSCAKDLALLACEALQNPDFRDICEETNGHMTVGGVEYWMTNHNRLLKEYPGCIAGKTGYTMAAGRCLVTCAEREGTRLICVTLSDPDDWADHTALYDWAFDNYAYAPVIDAEMELRLPVAGGENARLSPESGASVLLERGELAGLETHIELPPFVFGPVKAGEALGRVYVTLRGEELASRALRAAPDAAKSAPLKELARYISFAGPYYLQTK